MKLKSNLQVIIERELEEIKAKQKVVAWLKAHKHAIGKLELTPSVYKDQVDFDNLSHANVRKVMRAFPAGKWSKQPSGEARVHYSAQFEGITIRCYNGEPPAACRIVEEQILVPARMETVRRLVCPKNTLTTAL